MTAHTHDDAFHEIQLNGKQLVFLVMAATIVSVAIFLIGVLVGRNVRTERAALMQSASSTQLPAPDLQPSAPSSPATPPQAEADPRVAAPPPTVDDTDAKRTDDAVAEVLKPAAPRPEVPTGSRSTTPAPVAKAADKPQAAAKATAAPTTAGTSGQSASSPAQTGAPGSGYAVQVAALNVRDEADAIAKRLSSKGYTAYVQTPTSGSVYRVRVGTFKTRREAESVAARLQKEEQFKPWVTR